MIVLPFPPGVNSLYPDRGERRRKSERYRDWKTAAGWELKRQRPRALACQVDIDLDLWRPDDRHRDIDGLIKAPVDLLVTHGVIVNDHWLHLRRVAATWRGLDRANPRVEITIREAS